MKNHIGETKIANNGLKMTIIAYRRNDDIDIKFEDNEIVYHKSYRNFLKGSILKPKQNIHDYTIESISKNGQKMKIIKIRKSNDIDVQFEDGTIVTHKTYQNFLSGYIRNPNTLDFNTNSEVISSIGLKMKIVNFRKSNDIDIQFEDGKLVKNKDYSAFKKGAIQHPLFINAHKSSKNYFGFEVNFVFENNKNSYYVAKDLTTTQEFIATLQEIYDMKG